MKASFEFAYFGLNLVLKDAVFDGPVDFIMIRVERYLRLEGATFKDDIALYGSTVGILSLDERVRFESESLNLRAFEFKSFDGKKDTAAAFVRAQDPAVFSREPYLQLENFYSSIGDEPESKSAYYQGRKAFRDNARSAQGATEWSPWTNAGDLLLKYLTGYGVRTYRLLFYIGFFLLVGTYVFWQADTVSPKSSSTSSATLGARPIEVRGCADRRVANVSTGDEESI